MGCYCVNAQELLPEDPQRAYDIGREICRIINLDAPGLEQMKAFADVEDYINALKEYRKFFINRARATDVGQYPWHSVWPGRSASSYELVGMGTQTSNTLFDYWTSLNLQGNPLLPHTFNWNLADSGSGMGYGNALDFVALVATYYNTNDLIYMQKWFQISSSYSETMLQMLELTDNDTFRYNFIRSNFNTAGRTSNMLLAMSTFAKMLQPYTKPTWNDINKVVSSNVSDVSIDTFPLVEFGNIVLMIVKEQYKPLMSYYDVGAVPNQRMLGLKSLVLFSTLLGEFDSANEQKQNVNTAMSDVASQIYAIDGGQIEKSIGYNTSTQKDMLDILAITESSGQELEYAFRLKEITNRFRRLYASLQRPMGYTMSIGNSGGYKYPSFWSSASNINSWLTVQFASRNSLYTSVELDNNYKDKVIEPVYKTLFTNDKSQPPSFTSIAFPYTGYYALRTGWNVNDMYVSFINPPSGRGHYSSGNNAVGVFAYGRELIVDQAGVPIYDESQLVASQKSEINQFNHYLSEDATYKLSTVMVDGSSQNKSTAVQVVPSTKVLPSRWHTSSIFDFTEGLWENGYKDVSGISHKREVMFIKPLNISIVSDIMQNSNSTQTHNYSQMWHFKPYSVLQGLNGFTDTQVVFDTQNNLIKTTDVNAPNVWLYQFSGSPFEYAKFYGQKGDEYIGWFKTGYGSEIIPAVDMHVKWSDTTEKTTTMVSAIIPTPDSNEVVASKTDLSGDGVTGFKMIMVDGSNITYVQSKQTTSLSFGQIPINAKTILAVERANEPIVGIALDCESVDNKATSGSCEFKIKDNEFYITKTINIPLGFRWVSEYESPYPVYANNDNPVVQNVCIVGKMEVGERLAGNYTYIDPNDVAEGRTTYRWLSSSSLENEPQPILGATDSSYILKAQDSDKYIFFEVTPRNQNGEVVVAKNSYSPEDLENYALAKPTVAGTQVLPYVGSCATDGNVDSRWEIGRAHV